MHNLIDIVIISKGINYHKELRLKHQRGTFKHKNCEYRIEPDKLFLVERNPFTKLKDLLLRRKYRFKIVFREDKPDALEIPGSPKIGSDVLYIAERSKAMSNAIKELFTEGISGRKVVFIIILFLVIVTVYLAMTGKISLPYK